METRLQVNHHVQGCHSIDPLPPPVNNPNHFQSETGPNYYKEVPLSEILSVDAGKKSSHCFEIKTANLVFYVGEDSASSEASSDGSGDWESAIKSAVTPVVKTSSTAGSSKEEAPPSSSSSTKAASTNNTGGSKEAEKEKEGRETEISKAYQIFPDEVLGSGQFGIVYGGVHRYINNFKLITKCIEHP